jgi:hypothetical protein
MSQSDDQGRSGSGDPAQPSGQPPYGRPEYGQPEYGQPQYGQPQHGQPQYGRPEYGQQEYGQQEYGQSAYGHQQYGQPPYGQQEYPAQGAYGDQYAQQYGQPPAYGQYGSGQPAKPGTVVTAAVLGFVFGAFGVIITLLTFVAGSAASSVFGSLTDDDVTTGIVAIVVLIALLVGAWTVITIWGSVWALTGRSRVLLIVGGSIAIAFTLFGFLASIGDSISGAGDVIWSLLFLVAAIAIVVLLSVRSSANFFAAHRARRGR